MGQNLNDLLNSQLLEMANKLGLEIPNGTSREKLIELLGGKCDDCDKKQRPAAKIEVHYLNLPTVKGGAAVIVRGGEKECLPCQQKVPG